MVFPGENQTPNPRSSVRVLLFFLKTIGWLLAHTPEALLRVIVAGLGDFMFLCLPRRRRLVLSNLHHAFPDKPLTWHYAIGRESCRRLIETGLMSLATPFLNEQRLRSLLSPAPSLLAVHAEHRASPAATLICSPHLAYWEVQTAQPLLVPSPFPEFGIIFRPLDNPAANDFIKSTRERFGMKLFSRKEGFVDALRILRRGGLVGVLFDQNAGVQGALSTLFGRVCSTTELPGLLAQKFKARVYGIFPRRLGFWRVEIGVQRIESDGTSEGVTLGLNRWLETLLQSDDNLCASWLWAHDRWRHQDNPARRFRLEAKRDLLAADLRLRGLVAPRRCTRFWIRLPNWLGDVAMALPLLRALRAARPDAEITLVGKQPFLDLLKTWNVADRFFPLPRSGRGYFATFRRLRTEFPDVWLLFTQSFRSDLEAKLAGCRQRFGLVRPGKRRPLLTHRYHVPADFDEQQQPQLKLWENFLGHFGLEVPPDRTPLTPPLNPGRASLPIGLIAGSENNPEKRWPIEHWRSLIAALPHEDFVLFGTAADRAITSVIAAGHDPSRVEDAAGKTDLLTFAARLRGCRFLVTNDTGGMHLANAMGVPLVALFGPTNPQRTGPVFDSPALILQPPGCPSTGGAALADLKPEQVAAAIRQLGATVGIRV